ncbi:MAG: amidohydrolase [Blastocatellia bacterium]|nr:amidohydrolase [Blastocatellia bacterium]
MKTIGLIARLTVALLLFPSTLVAQDWGKRIESETARVEAEIVALRQRIHQYPELSNREEKTARLVAEHLKKLGFEVQTGIAHHGVIAILKGGKPGPVIAVRADMDALPVTEDTPLPFKSTVRATYLGQDVGVMHACGHDIHTAVQLGVASVLTALKADLPGTIKFIFQPAEEGAPAGEEGGAKMMVAESVLENPRPQVIFGLHTFSEMQVGEVGYTEGPALAATDTFEVRIIGKQSHGAAPELSVDPVVTAAQFVLALQTIRSRVLSPLEPSVITVGTIHGGQRHNIIPAEVRLSGTVRTYNEEVRRKIEEKFHELLKGITSAAGGSFEVVRYEHGVPAVINNPALTRESLPALERVVGKGNVKVLPPTMGGEDFSYFSNVVPGFFYRLGMVKPGTTSGGHHTPTFLADDTSVAVGIKVMSNLLVDYLERHKQSAAQ